MMIGEMRERERDRSVSLRFTSSPQHHLTSHHQSQSGFISTDYAPCRLCVCACVCDVMEDDVLHDRRDDVTHVFVTPV